MHNKNTKVQNVQVTTTCCYIKLQIQQLTILKQLWYSPWCADSNVYNSFIEKLYLFCKLKNKIVN